MTLAEKQIAIKVLDELNNKKQEMYADLIEKDFNGNPKILDMLEEDAIDYNIKIQGIKEDISLLSEE